MRMGRPGAAIGALLSFPVRIFLPSCLTVGCFRDPYLEHARFCPRSSPPSALMVRTLAWLGMDVRPRALVLLFLRFRFLVPSGPPGTASPPSTTRHSLLPSHLLVQVGFDLGEGVQVGFVLHREQVWCWFLHVRRLLPLAWTTATSSFPSFHVRASICTSRSTHLLLDAQRWEFLVEAVVKREIVHREWTRVGTWTGFPALPPFGPCSNERDER